MNTLSRRAILRMMGAAGAAVAVGGLPRFARRARAQSSMIGRIVQTLKGDVTIHTYIAPPASFLVTSHIIETPNQLIVVDTQFLQTAARDVLAYAEGLGKPIERVILSHAHPDHSSGGNIFADAPFVTTAPIAEGVQADIDAGGVQQRAELVGESEVPAEPRLPEASLEAGTFAVDGVTFDVQVYDNAEAPQQIVLRLPDHGVVVAQDLVYTNGHAFPGVDRQNWISILEGLRAAGDFDTLLSGHGMPTSPGELTQMIRYLSLADELAGSATSADDVISALTAEYPGYEVEGILQFWGLFIQPS
jgi:glyoxylase-like metal-dependent hydrolase (beta-lactamase superfamily II)